jgi:hypothetical protein
VNPPEESTTPARPRRRLVVLLATVAALGGPLGNQAYGEEPEGLLFLGIQRSTTIDKLASQIIIEHLQERGEKLLPVPGLSDTDRRCRRQQCLAPIATQRKAAVVLDGDVQQTGVNRSLRVVMHLYDSRKRQQQELENLCVDCDETKLGIVLTNTTTDLLGQYRKTAATMDQLAALLDATPGAVAERTPATSAEGSPDGSKVAGEARVEPTPPGSSPVQSPPIATPAGALSDAAGPGPMPSPATVGQSGLPLSGPAAYPTPLPPPPLLETPLPSTRPAPKGLSTKRKAIAGVFGAIGAGTLVASIVLTILDQKIASNYRYNPGGSPCLDPQYLGQSCVYSTIRLWAPGYGVGALLLGGMILTLAVPEHDSQK